MYRNLVQESSRNLVHDPAISAPTAIFVPDFHYPHGCIVELSDGSYHQEGDTLFIKHTAGQAVHTLRLLPKTAL